MLRFMAFAAIALALTSAFGLYTINYQTRRIAIEVQAKENHRIKLVSDIAVLKAERAYLGRAERIGPAAQAIGMRPTSGNQYVGRRLGRSGCRGPIDGVPAPRSIVSFDRRRRAACWSA